MTQHNTNRYDKHANTSPSAHASATGCNSEWANTSTDTNGPHDKHANTSINADGYNHTNPSPSTDANAIKYNNEPANKSNEEHANTSPGTDANATKYNNKCSLNANKSNHKHYDRAHLCTRRCLLLNFS